MLYSCILECVFCVVYTFGILGCIFGIFGMYILYLGVVYLVFDYEGYVFGILGRAFGIQGCRKSNTQTTVCWIRPTFSI